MADRAYYRIEFPTPERPELRTADGTFEVVDCSELGVRYRLGQAPPPTLRELVDGVLMLKSGVMQDVAGSVVWRIDREVGVFLDRVPIPLPVMLAEQRRLRRLYRHGV